VETPDDARLLSIASSISDGTQVNWTQVQDEPSDPHASSILNEMAVLDRIAAFHRSTQPSDTPTESNERHPAGDLRTWGHFTIIERVGSGGFGTVYRAKDRKLQSEVALKLLWHSSPDPRFKPAVALKEPRLLARVRHPNVVTVHGTDYIDGRVGIWMEFVKGRTLASLLREQGPFGAREAALIGFDLCGALAAVHRAGLLHGDVKAHNVMREEGGRTVLMDFGTGKDLASDAGGKHTSADFAGTPLYVAPEVFEGRPRTKLADIYSLGVLLYHLVTSKYPVDGRTRTEVAEAHRRGARRYLRDDRPDLPAEFVAVIERALAVDPRERYQSAGAFEAALAPIIGRTPRPEPRPSWVQIALAAAAVLALAVGTAYWVSSRPRSTQPPADRSVRDAGSRVAPSSSSAAAPDVEPSYQIDTALYRMHGVSEDRLRPGSRVAPGDNLFAKVRVSVPAYVYIVNEDDRGESYLLFPLPGQTLINPLPAGTTHRIPGVVGNEQVNWQVTSAGGREHFLIFASPERLPAFEQMFAALPRPEIGKPIRSAPLSAETIGHLRGIGGLTSGAVGQTFAARLTQQFPTPLGDSAETARGLWVRQFTVDNPTK